MKKIVAILMAMIMVMSVTVVLASGVTNKDTQPKVRVIIGFEDKPSQADKDMIRGCGGDIKHSYTIIDAIAAKLPEQAIDKIEKNPRVAYVEMDAKVHALGETLPWGVDRIDAEIVHADNNKGMGVKVAIIDSGIDKDHPDLQANIKGGVNFVSNPPWRPADPEKWDDDNGHGTHCAGIVAAVDNEEGVIGVAPEAHLYGVKVLDRTGSGYLDDVIAGIQWSKDNSMHVISMSLGTDVDYQSLHDACDAADTAGIVVVAAAGNSGPGAGTVIYPAKYDSAIAVSATTNTDDDDLADFSSRGPEVELAAPGVSIYSTIPGGYDTKSGTSMACPHVSGTAALVIASGITDNDEVRARLRNTAEDLGDLGFDTKYGCGLVDAEAAAASAVTLESIAVTPGTASIPKGLTQQYKAEGTYSDDSTADITSSVTWTSSNTAVATINSEGLATGVDAGTITITASSNSISDTATLTVTLALESIAVTPETASIPKGLTQQYKAEGTYSDDSTADITSSVTWASSDTLVATINSAGLATGVGEGNTVITATLGSEVSNEATLTVTAPSEPTTVSVNSIDYSTEGGREGNKHLLITVALIDNLDNSVADASVSITVYLDGSPYGSYTGMAGTDGTVTFRENNAPSGTYTTTVTDVTAGGLDWDGITPENEFKKS